MACFEQVSRASILAWRFWFMIVICAVNIAHEHPIHKTSSFSVVFGEPEGNEYFESEKGEWKSSVVSECSGAGSEVFNCVHLFSC